MAKLLILGEQEEVFETKGLPVKIITRNYITKFHDFNCNPKRRPSFHVTFQFSQFLKISHQKTVV